MPGDVAVRAQPQGASVHQSDGQAVPLGLGMQPDEPGGLKVQDFFEKSQGQALAGIAQGGGGHRAQFPGQPPAEAVGAPGPGVGQGGLEGGVNVEALEDQVPEGDDGVEEPVVEAGWGQGGQAPERASGQQVEEGGEQPGPVRRGGGGARGGRGGGVEATFFDWHVCMYDDIHTM